jgi:hypothetical protein
MTTWVPDNYIPVMLVGTTAGENTVITCKTGNAYSLSSIMQIPVLPPGVILMGNCTLDHDDSFRLLIYDGENIPTAKVSTSDNGDASTPDGTTRYEKLREFFPRYFQASDIARRTFVLQWVGFFSAASRFLSGEINVGHKIGGLLSLTDDAMKPTRPVRLQLPVLEIRRFREDTRACVTSSMNGVK